MGIELHDCQTTLKSRVTLSGIGVHSGQPVTRPFQSCRSRYRRRLPVLDATAAARSGRLSRKSARPISARCSAIHRLAHVATVEHLMAALFGLGIDNVIDRDRRLGSADPRRQRRRLRRRVRPGRHRAAGRPSAAISACSSRCASRTARPGPSSGRMPARASRSRSTSRIRRSAGRRSRPTSTPTRSAATSRAPAPSAS